MRRLLPSPAMVVALVALVIAASGGAYAAVSSSKTISACVHRHGGGLYTAHKCARHDQRLTWDVTGPQGAPGPAGPFPQTLPGGKTLTGVYDVRSVNQAYTFAFPLAVAPAAHYMDHFAAPTPQCPGSASAPAAAPGNLCLYEGAQGDNSPNGVAFQNPVTNAGDVTAQGFDVYEPNGFASSGTWAVTAPVRLRAS